MITYILDEIYTFSKEEVRLAEKEFKCLFSRIDGKELAKWLYKKNKTRNK